jgi:hypothetical protein
VVELWASFFETFECFVWELMVANSPLDRAAYSARTDPNLLDGSEPTFLILQKMSVFKILVNSTHLINKKRVYMNFMIWSINMFLRMMNKLTGIYIMRLDLDPKWAGSATLLLERPWQIPSWITQTTTSGPRKFRHTAAVVLRNALPWPFFFP